MKMTEEFRELIEIKSRRQDGNLIIDLELEDKKTCQATIKQDRKGEASIRIKGDDTCKKILNGMSNGRGIF